MQEIDRRVGFLRLMLADITDRERQASDACQQLRAQIKRVADFTVQRGGSVASALAAMSEIEERLAQQETLLRHLAVLRQRARGELETLLVTRDVSGARERLAELETRRQSIPPDAPDASQRLAEIDAEILELRSHIEAASDAAARSLTGDTSEPR